MAKLELNLTEKSSPKAAEPVIEKKVSFKERIPSNWVITPSAKKDHIRAVSRQGEVYEGTIKEFNESLRG